MECAQSSRIGAYRDGELSSDARAAFAAHLTGCPVCATELARLERLSNWMAAAHLGASPKRAGAGMDWQSRLHQRRLERLAGVLTAAAAAVVLGCAVWLSAYKADASTASSTTNNSTTLRSWERAAVTGQLDAQPAAEAEDPMLQLVFQDQ